MSVRSKRETDQRASPRNFPAKSPFAGRAFMHPGGASALVGSPAAGKHHLWFAVVCRRVLASPQHTAHSTQRTTDAYHPPTLFSSTPSQTHRHNHTANATPTSLPSIITHLISHHIPSPTKPSHETFQMTSLIPFQPQPNPSAHKRASSPRCRSTPTPLTAAQSTPSMRPRNVP